MISTMVECACIETSPSLKRQVCCNFEFFKLRQCNYVTVDISNNNNVISLGARLQGGKHVIETALKNFTQAHD